MSDKQKDLLAYSILGAAGSIPFFAILIMCGWRMALIATGGFVGMACLVLSVLWALNHLEDEE